MKTQLNENHNESHTENHYGHLNYVKICPIRANLNYFQECLYEDWMSNDGPREIYEDLFHILEVNSDYAPYILSVSDERKLVKIMEQNRGIQSYIIKK